MASRLHESINSLGVLLSLAVSFFGFYYEHIRTSEAVDAVLSTPLGKTNPSVETNDMSKKIESMSVDLLLLNKGDSSVTVSDLWFELDFGEPLGRARAWGLKATEDELITPIAVPSMQATKIIVRCKPGKIPGPVRGMRLTSEGDPPSEPLPSPPPMNPEKISIALVVTTIGPNYGRQQMKMPVGVLHLKDWSFAGSDYARASYELTPIRKDPPFFKAIWDSLVN